MCQSKADGGRRCAGTPTGRALSGLYLQRAAAVTPSEAEGFTKSIERLKAAEKFYGGRFVSPYTIPVPDGVSAALDTLESVGTPLIVGGAVRDSMSGSENKDIDIEVYGADVDTIVAALRGGGFKVDEVGRAFGVLKVSKKGVVSDLDVSVPRRENTTGAGHRDFTVEPDSTMSVVDAAQRRDFTVNAVSYDPSREVLVDPFNGRKDFDDKVLRHVGDQFGEDPLRVLRGFQFAGRFGMSLDPSTAKLCRNLREHYRELPVERVREEWGKFFTKSTSPATGVRALQEAGWDDTIHGLREALKDVNTVDALDRLVKVPQGDRTVMGAAIIAAGMPSELRREFLSTVLIGKDDEKVAHDLASLNAADVDTSYARRVLARKYASRGFTFQRLATFARDVTCDGVMGELADRAVEEGLGSGPEPDWIQGRDIIKTVSRKPGPWLGNLLDDVRDRQYRREFANADEALSWVIERAESP
ncbi:MAG: CCA tRNA nucleotidyltransferase [Spirochaetes bacterium]|nr:MAG: CCA tRNA nucleotidyltransferase [Spirochaetota bacterium]